MTTSSCSPCMSRVHRHQRLNTCRRVANITYSGNSSQFNGHLSLRSKGSTRDGRQIIFTGYSPPRASSSGEKEKSSRIRQVNEEELEVEIVNREKPLIIDFFATWCGPCVMLQKELEQVADTLGDSVQILKIDCDENENISSALQIQGLPTLIFVGMDAEKPALRTEGLLPAQSIIDIIQNEM